MIYFNNDIKKINYQGYDITKVYACGGELVWNASKPLKFKSVTAGGEAYTIECNDSPILSSSETRTGTYYSRVTAEIGNCVTEIGAEAFRNYYNLVSVELPNSITKISDRAFMTCRSLISIDIPSGVTSIGDLAFYTCSGLTSITVHATEPPALGSMAFQDTNSAPIFVPCESVDSYKSATNWSDYASRIQAIPNSCSKLVYTADGNTYSIDCDNTSVLGENYEVIRNVSDNGAKVSGVTDAIIGTCVNTIYANTFNYFTNLSSVTLTQNVTTIGDNAFSQCYKLTGITLPQSVTTIGEHAFETCTHISAVTIPNGVSRIETEVFQDCNRLKTIILPSTITSIGQYAFTIQDTTDTTEKAAKKDTLSGRSVYIYATTPPTLSQADVFESNVPNVPATYAIYVPPQSVEAYRTAEHWRDLNDVTRIQAMP